MAITVQRVLPASLAQVTAAHPAIAAGVNAQLRCSAGAPLIPDLDWLKFCIAEQPAKRDVLIAHDGAEFAALVVVRLSDHYIEWFVGNAAYSGGYEAAFKAVGDYCKASYGVFQGIVENPTVRAKMIAAYPTLSAKDQLLSEGP